jgi:hypothetical protein
VAVLAVVLPRLGPNELKIAKYSEKSASRGSTTWPSRPSPWFARTKLIVPGAVVPKSDSCECFFLRSMLVIGRDEEGTF